MTIHSEQGMPRPGRASSRRELLQLLKGTPQPELSLETAARRIGISVAEVEELVRDLRQRGRIRRDGDRLIVVEPAAARTDDTP